MSSTKIAQLLKMLVSSLPRQSGTDHDSSAAAYVVALHGFEDAVVGKVVQGLINGTRSLPNPPYCPTPPELAKLIREYRPPTEPGQRCYLYDVPASNMIARRMDRNKIPGLVDSGDLPRGCIWLPDNGSDDRNMGSVYGPDPKWRGAIPYNPGRKWLEEKRSKSAMARR